MIGKTEFDETYIFKISTNIRFFYVSISMKILFFRLSFTLEPGHSLLRFVTTNCLISRSRAKKKTFLLSFKVEGCNFLVYDF